jgi:hypothetical protein
VLDLARVTKKALARWTVDHKQPLEIEIPSIEQVISTGLDAQQIQGVDLVHLAIGDVNERGNGAAQVQQGVEFDGRLVRTKRCPWVDRQTQIDRGGVEGVDRCVQLDCQRVLRIQRSRHCNQVLRQVGVDLLGPSGVRIGQRVAGDGLAT